MTIDMNKKLNRPAGHHTITPGFSDQGSAKALEFQQKGFGAEVVDRYDMPNGALAHCEVRIGDSVVMFGGAMPVHPAMLASVQAAAGLIICATTLVILEIRRVELANFLPALVLAPLLTKFLL